jgi:hypothetical protein
LILLLILQHVFPAKGSKTERYQNRDSTYENRGKRNIAKGSKTARFKLEIRCSIRLSYGRRCEAKLPSVGETCKFPRERPMKSSVFGIGLVVMGLVVAFGLLRTENRKENDAMNSLMVIVPYKYEGLWVFDDAAVGLSKEPFIAGIDTLIDKATANIPDAQHGFRALFSGTQFPGANFKLEWRRAESGGNWYYSPEFNQEGWLCPALFKYFKSAPREIYVKVEPRSQG